MMVGLPVIGLATTELPRVIADSGGGYVDTEMARLVDVARRWLRDPGEARERGQAARAYARERFGIERFVADWSAAFDAVAGS